MLNKTYSERRQAALFKAAREYVRIACTILNDVRDPAEFQGTTFAWSKEQAALTMKRANELFAEGHEITQAGSATESAEREVRRQYSEAINKFEERAERVRIDMEKAERIRAKLKPLGNGPRLVFEADGEVINLPQSLADFRGDFWTVTAIEQLPSPGRSGKVLAYRVLGDPPRTLYPGVFGCIIELPEPERP